MRAEPKERIRSHGDDDKVEIQMTPMIDIVFQLLVFFIMTFKIVAQEGDFNIRMPMGAREGPPPDFATPPVVLRMTAQPNGDLAKIYWTNRPIKDFKELRAHTISRIGDDRGPGSLAETLEIELNCDYNLKYLYVIQAITSVSGYRKTGEKDVTKLIKKIRFSQPKQAPKS